MNLTQVENELKNLPWMKKTQAEILKEIFTEYKIKNALELGFLHGLSTCYMASILDDLGVDGKVTTIDLLSAKELQPNIEENLKKLNLEKYVEIFYEPRSYTWRLMKFLEENPRRSFDFCYIDGGHVWDPTGFAFFLVDKLLSPGGIIVFDDINWTREESLKNNPEKAARFAKLSEDEIKTPQVKKVFELLVSEHENYQDIKLINKGDWGFARKKL